MINHKVAEEHTSTQNTVSYSAESRTVEYLSLEAPPRRGRPRRASKKIENAVYAYIKAMRALGKDQVNTAEIASSLDLPLRDVERAAANLKEKGVKILR